MYYLDGIKVSHLIPGAYLRFSQVGEDTACKSATGGGFPTGQNI